MTGMSMPRAIFWLSDWIAFWKEPVMVEDAGKTPAFRPESSHDLIKRVQPYYSNLPSGGMMVLDDLVNVLRDLEVKFDNQHTELVEARTALEPFATFAANNTDENGWTSTVHREQISTWFGPSEFRAALTGEEGK